MSLVGSDANARARRRRMEIFAFLFLTAVLMPALAVATVGSYGLAVWTYPMMAGPPGPPTKEAPPSEATPCRPDALPSIAAHSFQAGSRIRIPSLLRPTA